ncbi:hypothetical protein DL766_007375 [Monosporascus sp. MC13-8B]|uniref:GAT domain-containing protein n=1 Tax=Monosporascus cannonballus TaxID=155416 RepID=A0ABY0GZR4_9PEZI|nr:hypothetical protein DL763_009882 [Monosporascus cannonballus]RYO81264.1 hypothetical protein DL762_007210 [Monosporascus cannonballus]RYP24076.1 hypothetical protein DL766_007375 [Monosporascus sp. MC13-8B]
MKSLKMNKVLGSIKKKATSGSNGTGSVSNDPRGDGPEATAARNVRSFCESGGPNSGDEILFLPPIVEAAESSPAAAAECARILRQYLKKDYSSKPSHQYNAIMLIRILADNPGPTFTRNLDDKFVKTAKELLRSNDPSVYQILMETLEAFENTKAYDEGLAPLVTMWKQEKKDAQKRHGDRGSQHQQAPVPHPTNASPVNPHSQNYFARSHSSRRLPDPVELASRLEEAKTSASLLHQVVSSTPPSEILHNDLIKEFADRCSSASRSVQGYISATDPAPDNDTMETLINTNEQLQASLSLHQRAVLNARKQASIDAWSADVATSNDGGEQRQAAAPEDPYANNGSGAPALPPRSAKPPASNGNGNGNGKGKAREYEPAAAGPSRSHTPASLQQAAADREEDNPFRDPEPEKQQQQQPSGSGSAAEPRLAFEPFHPGFGTTASYVGRQESAIGKEAMHGAGPRDSDSDIYDAEASKRQEPMYRY